MHLPTIGFAGRTRARNPWGYTHVRLCRPYKRLPFWRNVKSLDDVKYRLDAIVQSAGPERGVNVFSW